MTTPSHIDNVDDSHITGMITQVIVDDGHIMHVDDDDDAPTAPRVSSPRLHASALP